MFFNPFFPPLCCCLEEGGGGVYLVSYRDVGYFPAGFGARDAGEVALLEAEVGERREGGLAADGMDGVVGDVVFGGGGGVVEVVEVVVGDGIAGRGAACAVVGDGDGVLF